MSGDAAAAGTGLTGLARRVIEGWALAGGLVLLAVALMSTWSAATGVIIARPLPGDFELVEMGVAIAIFMFLPYCQITDANVTADIFTAHAGPRTQALLKLLSAVIALAFGTLLFWRMVEGMQDYLRYVETTTILRIPVWWAYIPALLSLALLIVACLISMRDQVHEFRQAA